MKPFSIRPFTKGVLKDIPPQMMPAGGLTDARGIRITDAYVERRKGYRRLNGCESTEYILGMIQFRDLQGDDYIFFGDRYDLYKLSFGIMRYWDDGYAWWDQPGFSWDPSEAAIYRITPVGELQVCPAPDSSSSLSESVSSSSMSSYHSCALTPDTFAGRDRRVNANLATQWSFAAWGDNLIASNFEDPIQLIAGPGYYRRTNLTCEGLRAQIVDIFQNHILCLNTFDYLDGAVPNRWWWSENGEATFDPADPSSEAGYDTIEPNSAPITGGARLRDSYCIFQNNMVHLVNYVGGTLVFSKQVVNTRNGALAKGLVQSTGDAVYFFGPDNVWKFDGYNFTAIADGNNRWLYRGMNLSQISQSFSFFDQNTNEIWFVVPFESDRPNLACIYDIGTGNWTFEDIEASAGCAKEGLDYPIIARTAFTISSSTSSESVSASSSSASDSSRSSSSTSGSSSSSSQGEEASDAKSYLMEVGVTDNDDDYPRTSYFITGEYTFGDEYSSNSDKVKELSEIWPVVEELSGDLDISVGTRMRISDPIVWTSLGAFTDQTLMGLRAYGVYISFKFEASGLDDFYRLSDIIGKVRVGGNR